MASIFTFECEPPRLSSPWPSRPLAEVDDGTTNTRLRLASMQMPRAELLADCGIDKLDAEPQEGSIEYKLHLLLRPRRSFSSMSTVQKASGSYLSKSRAPTLQPELDTRPAVAPLTLAPSSQSRQSRLQHLTTQLLWRLQQSSPYHSSSKSSLVLPVLPDADIGRALPPKPGPLIPGLEESNGALYEIGVSDDGTFVGLARDELEESLTVLHSMASSLGCNIRVTRMVIVGDCQWTEDALPQTVPVNRLYKERLWVAEVLVAPGQGSHIAASNLSASSMNTDSSDMTGSQLETVDTRDFAGSVEQLRISLTGSTTSGKSSLLGTLSTSTLDNGRGRSRLSLLKHRHEIVSGVTSSLAQELFGYQGASPGSNDARTAIVNYASGNVSSWDDIHNASEPGRLVFVTDSAGHPRYRRTTVRGLISWAPHWTLCCIAADDQEESSGKVGATSKSSEILGSAGVGVDLSKAHLDLCLKLRLPLVIVITKLDLATKNGLRDTLTKTLTMLKSAGRRPAILSSSSSVQGDAQHHFIAEDDVDAIKKLFYSAQISEMIVPIILTSAVTGSGISRLHALLRHLPLTNAESTQGSITQLMDQDNTPKLFHVDEVFDISSNLNTEANSANIILSGYLRHGSLKVGESMMIGPFPPDELGTVAADPDIQRARSYPGLMTGSPKIMTAMRDSQRPAPGDLAMSGRHLKGAETWQEVHITSLRNLRLPVRTLSTGQVGTIGIAIPRSSTVITRGPSVPSLSIRRGMVMLPSSPSKDDPPPSYSGFTAAFQQASLPAWPGVLVIIYIASIRAPARIIQVKALESSPSAADDVFSFDDATSDDGGTGTPEIVTEDQQTEISFEFASTREWFEVGAQVLVTPGGGPSLTGQLEQREVGSAGLDGYVGRITRGSTK